MLATLLQQWARRYLRITQPPRCRPHERARIRAFFAHGINKFYISWVADILPALVQLSLFLFFAGLLIYLYNLNNIIFRANVWWVAVSAAVYILITLLPIFYHETPYYAPLSSFVCSLYTGLSYLTSLLFCCICCGYDAKFEHYDDLSSHYRARIFQPMEKIAEETIRKQASKIDSRVLKWIFDALARDHDLDRFFQCILGFRSSKVVKNPHHIIRELGEWKLSSALMEFLHRTWSSNVVTESDKIRRLVICVKVADAVHLLDAVWQILDGVFNGDQRGVLESVEMGQSLARRGNKGTNLCADTIIGCIIASARKRDHHWVALVADQLGKSEDDINEDLQHGDTVLLANLVHVTRQLNQNHDMILRGRIPARNWDSLRVQVISNLTQSLSKFDIRNTLPRAQRDFCALWNELVQDALISWGDSNAIHTLIGFRRLYIALHDGTNGAPTAFSSSTTDDDQILRKPTSYPLCNLRDHQADVGATGHTIHPPPTTHPTHSTHSHHDAALTIPLPVPSLTLTNPHHTDQSLSGGVLDASLHTITATTSSHSVSFQSHPLPRDIAGGYAGKSIIEDDITTSFMVSDSFSLVPISAPTGDLHSPVHTAVGQSDSIPHGPVSSFSASTPASSHISPQVVLISNPNITTNAISGAHDHAQDPNDPTQPQRPLYPQLELAVPDRFTATLYRDPLGNAA